jgi:hypothetical protein
VWKDKGYPQQDKLDGCTALFKLIGEKVGLGLFQGIGFKQRVSTSWCLQAVSEVSTRSPVTVKSKLTAENVFL